MIDRAASILPNKVSSLVAPIFWRYQSHQANRNYTSFSSGDITQQDRTADHIVILVIDAFRPDHSLDIPIDLSSAVAPSTWTFPSVTSLHTGRLPSEHKSFAHKLPEEDSSERPDQTSLRPHLVADMDCAGYDTYAGCAFVTPFLTLKGWYQTHRVYPDVRAEQVLSDYLSWREGRDSTFAYLHLGDLHAPINPPQGIRKSVMWTSPCPRFDIFAGIVLTSTRMTLNVETIENKNWRCIDQPSITSPTKYQNS